MPRHPDRNPVVSTVSGSAFGRFAARLARLEGETYPLHIGDTYLGPTPGLRMQDLTDVEHPSLHRYANPVGTPQLIERLAAKVEARNGLPAEPRSLLVTPGATGALSTAASVTLQPGDEVLVLTPYWPLIRGIIQLTGARVVEVPSVGLPTDPEGLVAALEAQATDRTAAVYFSSPSNPTGEVFTPDALAAVASFARARDLWIWSDEVYEDYVYEGAHVSIATLAPERTLTAFSFSKAYGMTGHRVGYLHAPPDVMDDARRVGSHVWYSVTTASQALALHALDAGASWLAAARESYAETARRAATILGCPAPAGGTFLFLDTAHALDGRGLDGLLEDCLADNLLVAPGTSFGATYGTWVRLCFTAVAPDVALRGARKLAARIGVAAA